MIPLSIYVPVPPMVMVLVADEPRAISLEKVKVAVPRAGAVEEPKVKFPPMVMPPENLPVKSRVAVPAMVPPLIFNAPLFPIALTPPAANIPLLMVKPPV